MRKRSLCLLAAVCLVGAPGGAVGQALPTTSAPTNRSATISADEATTRAALLLMNDAVTVHIDGRHHILLRALRHLEDPKLGPLFAELSAANRHPSLRIHGLLASAELSPSGTLGADQIAQVHRADLQAELIGAALDGGLLDDETVNILLGWPGLDPAVKLLLATPRVGGQTFDEQSSGYAALRSALDAPVPGQRGLAALLLHELGDARGTEVLFSLFDQIEPSAEAVTAMLLETAWMHGLRRSGAWALAVADHDQTAERVEMLALKVAVRFGQAGADEAWSTRFAAAKEADNLSRRTRLALVGLEVAPWLEPERFDPLAADNDALIAKLGVVGREVAAYRHGAAAADAVESAVDALLESKHPQVWRWAAAYAKETGSAALGRTILRRYEPGETRGRSRRLEAVVNATRVVLSAPDADTVAFLIAALSDPDADRAWRNAVLLGLIRDGGDMPRQVAAQLPEFIERDTEALVLVLRTQNAPELSDDDRKTWEQLIQGYDKLDDSLRVQIAWAYLDRTGQGPRAIAALLAPGPATAAVKSPDP